MTTHRKLVEYAFCLAIKKPFLGKIPIESQKALRISKHLAKNPNISRRFNEYLHMGSTSHIHSMSPNFIHPYTKKYLNVQPFSSVESIVTKKIEFENTNENIKWTKEKIGYMLEPTLNHLFSTPLLLYDQIYDNCLLVDTLKPISFSKLNYEISSKKLKKNSLDGVYSLDVEYYQKMYNIGNIQMKEKNMDVYFVMKNIFQTFTPHFYQNQW